jgi:hypothetical protein
MEDRKLPNMPLFANEPEEAQWWFDHREELGQDLVAAQRNGLGESSAVKRARKLQESCKKTTAA